MVLAEPECRLPFKQHYGARFVALVSQGATLTPRAYLRHDCRGNSIAPGTEAGRSEIQALTTWQEFLKGSRS